MKYFLVFTLCFFTACTSKQDIPSPQLEPQSEIPPPPSFPESLKDVTEDFKTQSKLQSMQSQMDNFRKFQEQKQNNCLTSTVIQEKPVDKKTELTQKPSYQNIDWYAYYNTLCRGVAVILKCRCAYFNDEPTQWFAIKGTIQKPTTEEEVKTMLLEVCQSHNVSFKIHSCSN